MKLKQTKQTKQLRALKQQNNYAIECKMKTKFSNIPTSAINIFNDYNNLINKFKSII